MNIVLSGASAPWPLPRLPLPRPAARAGLWPAAAAQRGWSLLEATVAVALMGVIAVVVLSTLEAIDRQEKPSDTAQYLARAEDAVLGHALARFRLPEPVNAVAVPGRPGVVEGWLPAAELGLSPARAVRYQVTQSLTQAPAALYRADPLALAGDLIAPRLAANGVDFCVALLSGSKPAAGDGSRDLPPGFVLQAVDAASRPSAGQAPSVMRSRGQGELASRLGCLEKLSAIAAAVKASAVAADLGRLAALRVQFKQLLVAAADQSKANLEWQEANLAASMTRYALEETLVTMQLKSTPVALVKGITTMVTIATAIAGNAISISQTRAGLAGSWPKIQQAAQRLELALQQQREAEALTQGNAERSNRLLARAGP